MSSLNDLKLDAEELRKFTEAAQRPKVKDLLMIQLRKLETEIIHKGHEGEETEGPQHPEPVKTTPIQKQVKIVDIKTYAWDQSEKFMKIYATVKGVQDIPKEQVTCNYTESSFVLRCEGVSGKNHVCQVVNLHEQIVPADSYIKIKNDSVLVMLKKKKTGSTWPYVTKKSGLEKEKTKKPDIDDTKDPSDSLMTMMKQMYDDGDDEMKRTIAKAWTDSRDKQTTMPM